MTESVEVTSLTAPVEPQPAQDGERHCVSPDDRKGRDPPP